MPNPIERYYQVFPPTGRSALDLGFVLSAVNVPQKSIQHGTDQRAVVFVSAPLATKATMFVSAGALSLIRDAGLDVLPAPTSIELAALPDGLRMIVGDEADRAAYERSGE